MSEPVQRLFFALWPDQAVREQLLQGYQATAKQGGFNKLGRRVDQRNLHLTLHYLGATTPAQKQCYIEQARQLRFVPFRLTLDRVGFFPQAAVSWIGLKTLPQALSRLQRHLADSLANCGFSAETRTFQAHVTMARKLKPVLNKQQNLYLAHPVEWSVDHFVLVHSVSGRNAVEYRVIEHFYPQACNDSGL